MTTSESLIHLRSADISVVLDTQSGVPAVAYWGDALHDADVDAASWGVATAPPIARASLDVAGALSIVPEPASGHLGRPGLAGRRSDGSGWSPRFAIGDITSTPTTCSTTSHDRAAKLSLRVQFDLDPHGLLRARAELTNDGSDNYELDALALSIALPQRATELLTFSGRWCGEFTPDRAEWSRGITAVENRAGRTSHDRVPAMFAGTAGFGHERGDVWGLHLGWSGNAQVIGEVLIDGTRHVQLGELLLPGEIVLESGATYTTPWVYGSYGAHGLNAASQRFHRHLRDRAHWPGIDRPRKVGLNTWEAVYFDHDLDTLKALADRAAEVGIERYVLDDGWFHGRRDDTAGLGDWWVDADVWPDGLAPLIDHVRGLGLEFGIWIEPEMVNPDSDLYRNHPDWVLTADDYEPVLGRNQLVLDLANPDVFAYLLGHLDALLADHDVGYVKWDMNRNLVHASHAGRAGVHGQTLAVYALFDALRERHPAVEIESCSSGGARIDFAILERAERVWTSDSNDALDRHTIQRGFSYLFPPEIMGAHVGPPKSHTTGRRHGLAFRCATALFGHLGVEWNLLETTEDERAAIAAFIALHKRHRPLLHGGDVVRLDHPDPTMDAHGVVAHARDEAIVAVSQLGSQPASKPGPLRIGGLDRDAVYDVSVLPLPNQGMIGHNHTLPAWMSGDVSLTGAFLAQVGVALPVMHPESSLVLHLGTQI